MTSPSPAPRMAPPEYEIRTLDDFAKVPDDRLDVCLSEFAVAVRMHRGTEEVLNALAREYFPAGNNPVSVKPLRFVWIDDGETDFKLTVDIQAGDQRDTVVVEGNHGSPHTKEG